jgi:hypothetical protein
MAHDPGIDPVTGFRDHREAPPGTPTSSLRRYSCRAQKRAPTPIQRVMEPEDRLNKPGRGR